MGKLTVLFDGSAWLELLRVHPDFQRKGVGRAIYQRYFEQIKALGCPAARMYTGVSNKASAGLAEQFGLKRRAQFHSMRIPTENLSCRTDTKAASKDRGRAGTCFSAAAKQTDRRLFVHQPHLLSFKRNDPAGICCDGMALGR